MIFVEVVAEQLARRGAGVARQPVRDAATDEAPARPALPLAEPPEPVRPGPAVVVGEGEKRPRGRLGAAIASHRRPPVLLPKEAHAGAEAGADRLERFGTAVVDHDDLEIGFVLKRERAQAVAERLRTPVARNNHRYARQR